MTAILSLPRLECVMVLLALFSSELSHLERHSQDWSIVQPDTRMTQPTTRMQHRACPGV